MGKSINRPIIIAGPCSLEDKNQLAKIIEEFEKISVDMIRIGVWKPRTNPDSFQGIGEEGLDWIREIQRNKKINFAIEVATPKQVELALNANINNLWIGARTTTSPFAVQELADSLRGADSRVMVKNPINPDINLWLGAFERLNRAGINNVMAIHRGFQTGFERRYRNSPLWEIPLKLKQEIPNIPLLCDPSHIAGNRKLIWEIILYAKQLKYDGFMIEVHPNPESALSDSVQQLSIDEFKKILKKILAKSSANEILENDTYRKNYTEDQIESLYKQIEVLKSRLMK